MRYFSLGRKLPHLSLADCHAHLAQRHAPLVLGCRGFQDHCLHYRQNHIHGNAHLTTGEMRAEADPQFHYCSEFWYEDVDALVRAYHDTDYFKVLRPDRKLTLQRYAGFFDRCRRATFNRVSGQMDSASALPLKETHLPFHAISELWFESTRAAQEALACHDGRRLVAQAGWLPAHPDQGTAFWATERVIF